MWKCKSRTGKGCFRNVITTKFKKEDRFIKVRKIGNDRKRLFTKEETHMAPKDMKLFAASRVIGEHKVKQQPSDASLHHQMGQNEKFICVEI